MTSFVAALGAADKIENIGKQLLEKGYGDEPTESLFDKKNGFSVKKGQEADYDKYIQKVGSLYKTGTYKQELEKNLTEVLDGCRTIFEYYTEDKTGDDFNKAKLKFQDKLKSKKEQIDFLSVSLGLDKDKAWSQMMNPPQTQEERQNAAKGLVSASATQIEQKNAQQNQAPIINIAEKRQLRNPVEIAEVQHKKDASLTR